MKTKKQIMELASMTGKQLEKELHTHIRNGQHLKGIRQTIAWVLDEAEEN